ncbi:MAG: histidinol-phosphate aminotransferase [Glaciecola sp.]|jgi:histidinol-phosphate aminotransferase
MTGVNVASTVGPPPGARLRLSSNESTFGTSPSAVAAMQAAVTEANLYPDDQSIDLRQAIAAHEGVGLAQVAVGNGSAAMLMNLVAHQLRDGGSVVAYERGFIVYRVAARNLGVDYLEAPTGGPAEGDRDGYGRDPLALLATVRADTKVVFIDNPGNPTGAHLTGEELRAVVEAMPEHVTVVVDEAYHQFAAGQRGYQTASELGLEHPRLMVSRTFSKAYALAGQRVGYLTSENVDLVAELDGWRARFNVTTSGQAGAIAAMADTAHLAETVRRSLAGRDQMVAGLRKLGVPCTDGLGNFVTLECPANAGPLVEAFFDRHGVGVRPLMPYGMTDQIRVSVGNQQEVSDFLEAAQDVLVQR